MRSAIVLGAVASALVLTAPAPASAAASVRTYIVLDSGRKLDRPAAIHTTDQHRGRSTWVGVTWTAWGSAKAIGRGRGTLCNTDGCRTVANVTVFASERCRVARGAPYYAYTKITATYAVDSVVHSEIGTGYADVCRSR